MPQKIRMTLRPESSFEVPFSDGYQLYSALLGAMKEFDYAISGHTHDSSIGSISLGPLEGRFLSGKREQHKAFDATEKYNLSVGITDPREIEIFRAVITPLVMREGSLRLEKGALRVEELSSSTESFEEMVSFAGSIKEPYFDFEFKSTTSIQYKNSSVTEMFPHRAAVFHSLLSKWDSVCPEGLKMSIDRDDMSRFMIEKPLVYETRSTVVSTFMDRKKGHARPKMMQGFVGRCQYRFTKDAPEGLKNGIAALAKFAEYSGVGSAVARGCGAVKVEVGGVER